MASTAHFSTKDRILGAAEELFAQFGFTGTSLRQVTSRADVNIAAVNYHFGSKENLVNEVFRRRMDEMTAQRLTALKVATESHPGELEPILAAFVQPALAMAQDRHGGGAFVRVVARAYAEKNDGLRKFLSDHYGHVLRDFAKAIAAGMPGLSKEERDWRLDFPAGTRNHAIGGLRPDQAPVGGQRGDPSRARGPRTDPFRGRGLQELIDNRTI